MLVSPTWGDAMAALGVMPIHANHVASHMTVALLAAPRKKPVTLLPATASNLETANAAARLLDGPHMWRLTGDPLERVVTDVMTDAQNAAATAPRDGWSAMIKTRVAEAYATVRVLPGRTARRLTPLQTTSVRGVPMAPITEPGEAAPPGAADVV
mmetsp:Transcript_25475/g.62989  ORF Transcript_25475/g.62989 Transcript_25475/m.62989 type:complete len:155 (-) Transcript_25475:21-485(-)